MFCAANNFQHFAKHYLSKKIKIANAVLANLNILSEKLFDFKKRPHETSALYSILFCNQEHKLIKWLLSHFITLAVNIQSTVAIKG